MTAADISEKCAVLWHCNQSLTSQHGGGLMFCGMHENFFPHVELACAWGAQGGVNNLLIVRPGIVIHWDLHVNVMRLCYQIVCLEVEELISRSGGVKTQVQVLLVCCMHGARAVCKSRRLLWQQMVQLCKAVLFLAIFEMIDWIYKIKSYTWNDWEFF